MAFARIVVDATPAEAVRARLQAARDFASAHGASLTAVSCAWPRTSLVNEALGGSGASPPWRSREMEEAIETTRAIFDRVTAEQAVAVQWCSGVGEPVAAICGQALVADLVISGSDENETFAVADPAEVALRTGTPVLRLGSGSHLPRFDCVVIGWKDGASARRALHEALPLLLRAKCVLVAGVGDEAPAGRLKAVVAHLGEHGVQARPIHCPKANGVGDRLVRLLHEEGGDLLVTGAYGRGFKRERILGGVTRELLAESGASWLLAH